MKKTIQTKAAPEAVGPYSQGIVTDNLVFVSGQLPATPSGELITKDIAAATRQSLQNVSAVLEAAGASLAQVVKVTVFLKDMADFTAMNDVYKEFFSEPYPARAAIAVKTLPKDAPVEIQAIAVTR